MSDENAMAGTDRKKAQLSGNPKTAGPAIVLVEPQLGENIGTAARAMANFGLGDLRLVAPRDGWPNDYAVKAAAGADHVLDAARLTSTLEEAVGDCKHIYATTARPRDMVKPVITPEQAGHDMRSRAAHGETFAVLFGREKAGLKNDHVALADTIIMAPVNPGFASLNLAQAVLLVGYEWFKHEAQSLGDGSRQDGGLSGPGLPMPGTRPADRAELFGFFEHLEEELDAAGFLHPPEKRPAMVRNIRNLFHRAGLTEQEVRTLRGVVATLVKNKKAGRGRGK